MQVLLLYIVVYLLVMLASYSNKVQELLKFNGLQERQREKGLPSTLLFEFGKILLIGNFIGDSE